MSNKILIIRFSSIGDIVLTTPVIRCLKKQLPTAEIHYITKPQYKIIPENNPYIDKLHILDKNIVAKAYELKEENYDVVIDLHNNLRTAIFKNIIGSRSYSFPKLNYEKWLLVNFRINILPDLHIVDRYFKPALPLGIVNDGEGLDYFIPQRDHADTGFITTAKEGGYIAWSIGAQHFTKKFPNDKIINICKMLDVPVLLMGGEEDSANAEEICRSAGKHVINACGKYNLNQSASLIQQSNLVVTNDTGLMHIAVALKKPVISLWGNTMPEFGMRPYYGKSEIRNSKFEMKNLNCRPCSKIGFDKCPKGHFKCMRMTDDMALLQAIRSFYISS